jgi:hypothetical protein
VARRAFVFRRQALGWRYWAEAAFERRRVLEAMSAAARRMLLRGLGQGFNGWRARWAEVVAAKEKMGRCVRRMQHQQLAAGLSTWAAAHEGAAAALRELRAGGLAAAQLLARRGEARGFAALRGWRVAARVREMARGALRRRLWAWREGSGSRLMATHKARALERLAMQACARLRHGSWFERAIHPLSKPASGRPGDEELPAFTHPGTGKRGTRGQSSSRRGGCCGGRARRWRARGWCGAGARGRRSAWPRGRRATRGCARCAG